jgi:UDP:flavonoid glycosyltransferase YjiC (YdhE family)
MERVIDAAVSQANVLASVRDPRLRRGESGSLLISYEVPQIRVLERARLFITHGGHNSVMESLVSGVPMLVVPLALDQPVQAYFVERAKCGYSINPDTSVEEIRAVIGALLRDEAMHEHVRKFAKNFGARDGARRAANALESFYSKPAFVSCDTAV